MSAVASKPSNHHKPRDNDAGANGSVSFQARPSNKTAGMDIAGDGVVWKERLAVVEGVTPEGNPRLRIRSYFRNPFTHERVWDEPPSGASAVDFATAEMRQQAELQMKELQFTLDLIPPDQPSSHQQHHKQGNAANTPKKGLFGRFRSSNKKKATLKDDSKDLNLQRAIEKSMRDQRRRAGGEAGEGGSNSEDLRILYDSEFSEARTADTSTRSSLGAPSGNQEDEDLAMAKALSLSAAEQEQGQEQQQEQQLHPEEPSETSFMTEEEMIQMAIQQSQEEAFGVRKPQPLTPEGAIPMTSRTLTPPDAMNNRSSRKIGAFDPYSPSHVPSLSAADSTSRSSSPTQGTSTSTRSFDQHTDDGGVHKMESTKRDMERKKPARRLSRTVFGSRRRMEAQAGVL